MQLYDTVPDCCFGRKIVHTADHTSSLSRLSAFSRKSVGLNTLEHSPTTVQHSLIVVQSKERYINPNKTIRTYNQINTTTIVQCDLEHSEGTFCIPSERT